LCRTLHGEQLFPFSTVGKAVRVQGLLQFTVTLLQYRRINIECGGQIKEFKMIHDLPNAIQALLDVEAFATTTLTFGVWITKLEAFIEPLFDEIDFSAIKVD